MISDKARFDHAIAKFDELNSQDPNKEIIAGKEIPKELLYAQRMSDCLMTFHPTASEALQLAARCQHICRWEIPRSDFPKGRIGYNKWRNSLKKFHASKAETVLTNLDYPIEDIERVQFLVQKKQLKKDAETQVLEDVICLVFLNFYLDKFASSHTEEKVIDILRKTWRKMSEKGQQAALALSLSEETKTLVGKALN